MMKAPKNVGPQGLFADTEHYARKFNRWIVPFSAILLLLLFGAGGNANAQNYPCNTVVSYNPNLSYNPLGPSTQATDIQLYRSYNCPGSKSGALSANKEFWSDLSISVESINVSRGSIYNIETINRPTTLPGTGPISQVGFNSDNSNGGNVNTIRFAMSKVGSVAPGLRYFPIVLTNPDYSYFWRYSYRCGWFSTCYNSGYGVNSYEAAGAVSINVASAMALSLAGGGTNGTVDFGNALATDAKRSVNLRLRSNTSYKVSMDSAYNGVLKLNNQANATEEIGYTTTLNGIPISDSTLFTNTDPTGTGGADITLPFEITIGDTSNARAGFYKDIITLTIASGI
jgi:hypothetical protein